MRASLRASEVRIEGVCGLLPLPLDQVPVLVGQAEVANLEAELAMVRSENITLTTTVAAQQRDMEDLENGVMPRSRVPVAAAEILAEVVAVAEERAQKSARKPRVATTT